jgi:hypothetical protein
VVLGLPALSASSSDGLLPQLRGRQVVGCVRPAVDADLEPESFRGTGWIGILKGLGASPLALGVIRFVRRSVHGVVLRIVFLLCVSSGLRPGGRELSGMFFAATVFSLFVLRFAARPGPCPSRSPVSPSLRFLRPRFAALSWFLRHLFFFPLRVVFLSGLRPGPCGPSLVLLVLLWCRLRRAVRCPACFSFASRIVVLVRAAPVSCSCGAEASPASLFSSRSS